MKVVLLPLKDPAHAKQRLAGHLTSKERQELAWAMLEDVTRAVGAALTPDQVVVVTRGHLTLLAEQSNWQVIEENQQISESHSVDRACRLLQQRGASVVLRLPTDIPLLEPEDVDHLLNLELGARSAVIIPSRDGKGTNALLRTPPDAFPSRFGENSLALHQEEARRCCVELKILKNPRIAFDLDEFSDLLRFMQLENETRTAQVLSQFDSLKQHS
jgi:2-phospho-L-lactate guanylyltransferase